MSFFLGENEGLLIGYTINLCMNDLSISFSVLIFSLMGAWYISLSKITLYKVDREMDDIFVLPGFVETQFVKLQNLPRNYNSRLTMP
jgi:hypothetical protein